MTDDPISKAYQTFRRELNARVGAGAVKLPESFALLTLLSQPQPPPASVSALSTETSSADRASRGSSSFSSSPSLVEGSDADPRAHVRSPPRPPAASSATGGRVVSREMIIETLQALSLRATASCHLGEEHIDATLPATQAHHHVMMESLVNETLGFCPGVVHSGDAIANAQFYDAQALSAAAASSAVVGSDPAIRHDRNAEAAAASGSVYRVPAAADAAGGARSMRRYRNAPASSPLPRGFELRGLQASMAGVVPTLLPIADPAVEPESGGSVCDVGSDPLGGEGLWDEWPSLESVPDEWLRRAFCMGLLLLHTPHELGSHYGPSHPLAKPMQAWVPLAPPSLWRRHHLLVVSVSAPVGGRVFVTSKANSGSLVVYQISSWLVAFPWSVGSAATEVRYLRNPLESTSIRTRSLLYALGKGGAIT